MQICIFTVSNKENLKLTPAVETIFNRIPIVFDQYSLEQMYHILDNRCRYGFYPGVISDELIRVVANKSYNIGNLRYGIKALSGAGQKAEVFGEGKIIRNFLDWKFLSFFIKINFYILVYYLQNNNFLILKYKMRKIL